ncbi:MAG TPA: hypothetical protein PLC89_25350, partial [Haliscomenobacter sp.]|nr:hypothetical protein [Haliscomenobacter sp.]
MDTTVCASTLMVPLHGAIGGAATSGTWSTSGTGTFLPNATTLNAKYLPSAADTAANTVTLTLTTNDPIGDCDPAVDMMVVTIDPASIVNAGPDQTICATDTIYLNATLSGVANALVWQKNAAFGTFIGSDTSPNAKYVLNATGQQLSSIKFGVMSNDPGGNVCQGGLDTVQIFINPAAYVNAGNDTSICASTISVQLNGSISGAATSATWTTSGTGTFSPNATTLNATYTPSLADTAANTVILTLTTNDPVGALCGPAVDTKIITIDPASIVNAGPDQTICATDTIYLNATLSGVANALVWQKNAAFGTFIGSDTSPNAKYVLNATGQQLSSIKFGVMSNDPGGNVCQGGLDTVQIFINPAAYVNAGNDTSICASTISVQLNGSISGAATSATWTTSGTGTFSPNATTLNATYTPSLADSAANTVTLTLATNNPSGLCGPAVDTKIITIDPASIVNAGPDQTICPTDTIYLSATLSGVATMLVWQKNVAFGSFVGSDTSPNAKYVLNATGQALSSLKFGVMSNDPGGNVCQGGLDTVEIFIKLAATVSLPPFLCKDSTITVNSTVNGGLAPYSYSWTQTGGTGSVQITNNNDGTATINGINTGKISLEFMVTDANSCTGQAVDSMEVVDCSQFSLTNDSPTGDNFMINDPCTCKGNGDFEDVVWVEPTQAGQSWTVKSIAPFLTGGPAPKGIMAGDALSFNALAGIHAIVFDHVDSSGFSIVVEGPNPPGTMGNVFLPINNICYYPDIAINNLPALVSLGSVPITLTGVVANGAAGTGILTLNPSTPNELQKVDASPTNLIINPASLPLGINTITYSFNAGPPTDKLLSDPGCVSTIQKTFVVASCSCLDVTVTLDANCQFLLTASLISNGGCAGGTVRVMDNNPGNGGLIDCAGVWTYGLFDAFGNIICWGKVTAEDKSAPALICAPASITLDCYDVNYVLNNKLTIGNVGSPQTPTTSSPRPSATATDGRTITNAEGVAGVGDNCQLG